jgi:hypothetical protein
LPLIFINDEEKYANNLVITGIDLPLAGISLSDANYHGKSIGLIALKDLLRVPFSDDWKLWPQQVQVTIKNTRDANEDKNIMPRHP